MEIVEDTLDAELEEFLARPLFCHLGTVSEEGPRVSPLWFLWEDGAIWIIATLSNKTFPDRIEEDPRTAVSIVDFDPETGRVEHVGLRGHATVEPFEGDRGERLLSHYLGSDESEWDDQFQDLGDVAEKCMRSSALSRRRLSSAISHIQGVSSNRLVRSRTGASDALLPSDVTHGL